MIFSGASKLYSRNKADQVRKDSTTEDNTSSKEYKDFRIPTKIIRTNIYSPNIGNRPMGGSNNSTLLIITVNTLIVLSLFFLPISSIYQTSCVSTIPEVILRKRHGRRVWAE